MCELVKTVIYGQITAFLNILTAWFCCTMSYLW